MPMYGESPMISRARLVGLMARGGAVLAGAALAAGQTAVPADAKDGQQLEGSWQVTVTLLPPPPGLPPTFQGLRTFTAEGEVLASDNLPEIHSLGHGEWVRTGNRQFIQTFTFFRFVPPHQFIGTRRVTAKLVLEPSLEEFRANTVVEDFDVDGNRVGAPRRSAEFGRRLQVVAVPGLG